MASPKVYVTPVTAGLSPVNILSFNAITGVVNSIETTVDTYTALGDETVGDIIMGGTSYARFNVYINTILQFVVRSGPARQANLALQRPLQLVPGDIIDVKVIHYNLGWTDDFEATILGI
jgi:hypothetical protein